MTKFVVLAAHVGGSSVFRLVHRMAISSGTAMFQEGAKKETGSDK